jgi:hypothetical protein
METWRWKHGDKDIRYGNMEKWKHGEMETWRQRHEIQKHGDMDMGKWTRRHGQEDLDMETWTWRQNQTENERSGNVPLSVYRLLIVQTEVCRLFVC